MTSNNQKEKSNESRPASRSAAQQQVCCEFTRTNDWRRLIEHARSASREHRESAPATESTRKRRRRANSA